MDKLLFIVRSFSGNGAQPIRFRQIINFLRTEFDIHVLELTHEKGGVRKDNGITIHSLKYSRAGRVLNPPLPVLNNSFEKKVRTCKFQALLKRFIRSLLFPDSIVTEALRLKREALRLTGELKCKAVVVSAFPFTTLVCIKSIKQQYGTKIILDVGDPFFRNSRNGYLKDLLAGPFEKRYLQYTDILVVTNTITRDHYLRTYHGCLNQSQVRIVTYGVDKAFVSKIRTSQDTVKISADRSQFRLVYAGQLYRHLREPFELYKAVRTLKNDHAFPKIRLDMYGSFSKEFIAGNETSDCILFHGYINHEDLAGIYRSADAIVFIDNAYGMQTPGKIFEVALAGKPIVFISDNEQSPAREIITDMDLAFVTENDSEMIETAIRKIRGNTPDILPHSNPPINLLWESKAEHYRNILTELTSEKKN